MIKIKYNRRNIIILKYNVPMLFPQGISNVKYVNDKWGQNKIPKISQIKPIVHFIIKN